MKCVFLVSCVKKKKKSPHPAAELYDSNWFRGARRLVEATECPWFILSAKHHLLSPNRIIKPYNQTLNEMPSREVKAWAKKVQEQMIDKLPDADSVVILAGERYRKHLMPCLKKRYTNITIPMEGITSFKQLKWLKDANVENILP